MRTPGGGRSVWQVPVRAGSAGRGSDDAESAVPTSEDTSSGSDAASSKPAPLAITVRPVGAKGAEYAVPATVKGGVVTITVSNTSKLPREAQLIRVDGDQTADDVERAVEAEGAPTPSWLHASGGVTAVKPNGTAKATVKLNPGTHYLIDTSDPDFEGTPAKIASFTVTAGDSQAKLPSVAAQITASEYDFEAANLQAGTNQVRFQNTGTEVHHAILFPLLGDATIADAEKFFKTEGKPSGPPPLDFENGASMTALDGGTDQVADLTLKSGRYAAVCFITDRAGGPPHFVKGQIAELSVE